MSIRLFVGQLAERTSESALQTLFEECGAVKSVERRVGYAFVFYDDENEAKNAIERFNGFELDGAKIIVENARPSKGTGPVPKLVRNLELRVIIRGLNRGVNWQDLKDWSRHAGDVTYANVFDNDGDMCGVIEFKVTSSNPVFLNYFLIH